MSDKSANRSILLPGNAGIILVVVILVALLIAILFPVFVRRDTPRRPNCASNIRQLVLAVQMYTQDHENKFPPNDVIWQDVPFPPKSLICPEYRRNVNGYGYNAYIGGKATNDPGMPEPQNLPVIADSKVSTHLLQSRADIDPRHTQKAMVGYADGHIMLQPPSAIENLPVKRAR